MSKRSETKSQTEIRAWDRVNRDTKRLRMAGGLKQELIAIRREVAGLPSGIAEAASRRREAAVGAKVLQVAEITVPEGFDLALLASALDQWQIRHLIINVLASPAATERERKAVSKIVHAARAVAELLGPFLASGDEHPTDPVSRVPGALADAMASAGADEVEIDGRVHIASHPSGILRLKFLVAELNMLAVAGPKAQEQLKGDALFPPERSITPHVELLGRDLPRLYEELFGRPFKSSIYERATESCYSEGVRFVAAAASAIGVNATRQAVIDARKRFRTRSIES